MCCSKCNCSCLRDILMVEDWNHGYTSTLSQTMEWSAYLDAHWFHLPLCATLKVCVSHKWLSPLTATRTQNSKTGRCDCVSFSNSCSVKRDKIIVETIHCQKWRGNGKRIWDSYQRIIFFYSLFPFYILKKQISFRST